MTYHLVLTGKFKKGLKLAKNEDSILLYLILSLKNCFREYLWKKRIEIMS